MTFEEMVEAVWQRRQGMPKSTVRDMLHAVCEQTAETLKVGDEVPLPGLGKLVVNTRSARTGRNPHTGETIDIPETRVVKFKAAAPLKAALNQ